MSQSPVTLVDVVNFNADASCLEASAWLAALAGGGDSAMARWLRLYVTSEKPMVLGLTGASAADMALFNPESVALVRDHPHVFQVVARPFSHDAALLRTGAGFRANLRLGVQVLERLFGRVAPWFLPPEFMLTAEQTFQLEQDGLFGTFINPARFNGGQRDRLPAAPYLLQGALGSTLACLPVLGGLTPAYLEALDRGDAVTWNAALAGLGRQTAIGWRDGESVLLFPDGIERERRWLAGETVRRAHLPAPDRAGLQPAPSPCYRAYPMHPFTAWMREFRVMGYVHRLLRLEERVRDFDATAAALWLQCVNSDVLSSVEKEAVDKRLTALEGGGVVETRFLRSERGFEGSECLLMLERHLDGWECRLDQGATVPHLAKLAARRALLAGILGECRLGALVDGGGAA